MAGWAAGSGRRPESEGDMMATERQKEAARKNLVKARQAQSDRAHGKKIPHSTESMSTAEKDQLADRYPGPGRRART